ncbi:uncharacterized protein Nmag_0798 [Natrialba magadii ATCC 43099]|uniref:Uncharacterized protein n=1 Tax=Natrialba magadii (strain ATCC 43099 / DSM 3394 / CCM 3739 / CIP 104546 / IAM 13178 / JCM 8861 / NBRC 102185 / NCIMB 2190 / MS3) TaxID=547559 RepID=D3T024_NATMM|nr:hypothetical protein [Natrialba magadii]ADD04382.1 uncharacterized protein Nmag_0798 [Natrialba magadii ATCC 43099]ELY25779.1 hypothetical protein C500_16514 [Natrialba magadii ATCC 43099]
MEADVIGLDSPGVAIQVIDHRDYTHHLLFDWDGELIGHVQDRFTEEVQTDLQPAKILNRVRFRARNVGHHETDAKLLSPIFDWVVLDEAIDVLQGLDQLSIIEHFMDFLEAIRDPPVDDVEFTALYLHLDDANEELIDQSDPVTFYFDDQDLVHTPVNLEREPDVYVTISPLKRPFACDHTFRDLIVHQLKCQIRDLYYRQGGQPPEQYQVNGIGLHDTELAPFEHQAQ